MKVLWLGPFRKNLEEFLKNSGDEPFFTGHPLTTDSPFLKQVDFLVSYGYRYLLAEEALEQFKGRAINLHISYLPWNRGADPNLWSFLEDTPKGVSIHLMEKKLDAGPLLAQQKVDYFSQDTLRSSYERLSSTVEKLFQKVWPDVKQMKVKAIPQKGQGSFHRRSERTAVEHLLVKGWDTPVEALVGKVKEAAAEKNV
jgi:methionyl-tRNA formyltransferase